MLARLLGIPWVYDRLRPWALGGFDFSNVYAWLEVAPHDVVLDVGCGTGDALGYLPAPRAYYGFDVDARALDAFAARRPEHARNLHARRVTPEDVRAIRPTKIVLMGLLHHLPDDEARALLAIAAAAPEAARAVTLDPVLLPGRRASNLLARLDRGRWVRTPGEYLALLEGSAFGAAESAELASGNGLARYHAMRLERRAL